MSKKSRTTLNALPIALAIIFVALPAPAAAGHEPSTGGGILDECAGLILNVGFTSKLSIVGGGDSGLVVDTGGSNFGLFLYDEQSEGLHWYLMVGTAGNYDRCEGAVMDAVTQTSYWHSVDGTVADSEDSLPIDVPAILTDG